MSEIEKLKRKTKQIERALIALCCAEVAMTLKMFRIEANIDTLANNLSDIVKRISEFLAQ